MEEPKKFAFKPDIVITEEDRIIIADTKWKIIKEEQDISQSDMYQLFAYGKKYSNQELYLIYPKDGENQPILSYEYEKMLNLKVLFFDVAQKFDENTFDTKMFKKETNVL